MTILKQPIKSINLWLSADPLCARPGESNLNRTERQKQRGHFRVNRFGFHGNWNQTSFKKVVWFSLPADFSG